MPTANRPPISAARVVVSRICLLAALGASMVHAADNVRRIAPLNQGWRFAQAPNLTGAEAPTFDDAAWANVNVPHTWNRIGNAGTERSPESNSTQGVGWYRLHFSAPAGAADSRYFLQFDAVAVIAEVWLNGSLLGRHAGAFARFRFDATQALRRTGDNVLVVKADNSRPRPGASTQDVPPLSGDFFIFGGIYREVALIVTREAHADLLDYGGPGLYARATRLDARGADVRLTARLVDEAHAGRRVQAQFAIEDAEGHTVATRTLETTAGPLPTSVQVDLHVANPRRWQGTKDPYLYRSVLTLRSAEGAALDRVVQPFGLRTMEFDPNRGFLLNGEHLALHGVSRHQDRPVKGWAISRADQEQDFDLMQDMGVDAVRLAHYQHDQYSYELADRRGLVAWAEIPLVNKVSYDGSPANPAFSANARQQLLELIRQNYNHPSIAVWSIANEVDLTPTQLKGPSRASPLLEALNELAHEEDPARATTLADCCEAGIVPQAGGVPQGGAPRDELFGITDVLGYNRYFGWYTGQFADFGAMLDAAHARHPTIPIAVSEYGAGAALTQHSDDPGGGPINPHGRPHPEEYQNLYHEESWPALNGRPYLWAAFIWNMFDFSSDSRREGDLTDINEKGMVSDDRQTRKDAFYYYRANWSAAPTLHLVGRRYANRDYGVFDVKAYSNAAAARLRLNDTDLGVATCTAGICLWPAVHLREGRNEVSASATIAGRETGDSLVWNLPHPATLVRIKAGDISGCTTGSGERFGSDVYFDGGRSGSINPPESAAAQRKTVSAPTPMLYDTYREGQFSYRVPLPNGRYRITLKFAEPAAAEVGARVFDVSANGAVALDNFDIFAAAGAALKGVDESFDARVSENALTLTFTPRRGQALVSALSIAPLDSF